MAIVNIEVVGVGFIPLNQLDPRAVPSGTPVSDTGGGYWTLAKSSATVDHTSVEAVLRDPTLRWLSAVATSTTPGLMSAADKTKLTDLDFDGWLKGVVDIMHAAAPALTNFREIKAGDYPGYTSLVTAALNDARVVGGGIGNVDADGSGAFSVSLTSRPKTTSWAFACRAKLKTSTAAAFNFIGFINAANTHDYGIATFSTKDATKYLIYTYNGGEKFTASSLVCDDGWHTFVLAFDGTTITLFVDGVSVATQTDISKISDEVVFPSIQGHVALDNQLTRFAYGYIAP